MSNPETDTLLSQDQVLATSAVSDGSKPELAPELSETSSRKITWKKVRGGVLFVIGYLLSPLCWWNDLVFNLPVAYAFGYLCSLISSSWLLPGLVAGYWISNVLGILCMQFGAIDVVQGQAKERNLRKDLLTGVVSSTVYTVIILALVQFHIIDAPALLSGEAINLGLHLPISFPGQVGAS